MACPIDLKGLPGPQTAIPALRASLVVVTKSRPASSYVVLMQVCRCVEAINSPHYQLEMFAKYLHGTHLSTR